VPRKYVILIALTLGVVVADQVTKYLTLRDLTTAFDGAPSPMGVFLSKAPEMGFDGYHFRSKQAYTLSENFFRLRYAENPGAAFGLFRSLPEGARGPLFHLVSIGAVLLITFYFSKLSGTKREERWALYGLPLVLGGAVGNYIDRLARGFVIDFLEAHWFDKAAWPSFNVADMAICVGVGMLVVDSFVRKEPKKEAKKA
jgi:signal peptidase II